MGYRFLATVLSDSSSIWFWIVGGAAAALLAAAVTGMWKWARRYAARKRDEIKAAFHDWVAEPLEPVKKAVGNPNGQGDLTQMLTRALANQAEWQAQDARWKVDHDEKDDKTRADVAFILRWMADGPGSGATPNVEPPAG